MPDSQKVRDKDREPKGFIPLPSDNQEDELPF